MQDNVSIRFLPTEPCPPNNVEASVQCRNDNRTVSWEASFGAVGYKAIIAGQDGHSLTCNTNDTFCNIQGLHCGVVYFAKVIAAGERLSSLPSTTVLLVAGMVSEHRLFKAEVC